MSLTLVANLDPFGSIQKLTIFFFCKTKTLDRLTMVRKQLQKRSNRPKKQAGKGKVAKKQKGIEEMPPSEPDGDDAESVSSFAADSEDDVVPPVPADPNKYL
jgi:hypothetical protein